MELRGRLAILVLREYFAAGDPFQDLFERLTYQYPGKVFNLSRLLLVKGWSLALWHRKVLLETFESFSTIIHQSAGTPADHGIPLPVGKEALVGHLLGIQFPAYPHAPGRKKERLRPKVTALSQCYRKGGLHDGGPNRPNKTEDQTWWTHCRCMPSCHF
jgi:hypothetical protein